jgi:hypothetical protein
VAYTLLSQVEWSNKMILDDKVVVYTEGVLNESSFNIKEQNVAHIFSILRSQLYSDKIGAIIREYITNAIDAHTEANVSQPISISVPNGFSNEFIVRDYGNGLSKEDIINIFASYGESTKRNSNSFTGMLGIGSKSAFAYASSFTIISRHKGIKTIYQAYIDETNVGKIAEINSQPTDESGLSIHISTSRNDISQFENSLIEFFRYIRYRPEFLSVVPNLPQLKTIISGSWWTFIEVSSRNWKRSKDVCFVMGNVTYKATTESLSNQLNINLKWLDTLYSSEIIIDVPIGKIKPSASRESLEFNEITKKYLSHALHNLKLELGNAIREKFEQCNTEYEKHCTAYALYDKFSNLVPFEVKRHLIHIDSNFGAINTSDDLKLKTLTRNFPHPLDKNSVSVMPNTRYIVYHNAQKITHINPRISEYFEALPESDTVENLVVIKFDTKEHMDSLMNHPSLLGAEFINAITLPFTKIIQSSLKSEDAKIYEFKRGRRLNLETWKPATSTPPHNAVYIEISSFKPKHYKDNGIIDRVINALSNFGIKVENIYGVKTSDIKNTVQPNWIELKDYLSQKINQWKIDKKDLVRDYEYFLDANSFQKELISDYDYLSHLKTNLDSYHRHNNHLYTLQSSMSEFNISLFKYNPPKEFERLYSRYPFMKAFECTMSYGDKLRLIKYLDMS